MKKIFKIEGMSCSHCVMSVQKNLSKLNLNEFKVEIGLATIDYNENKMKKKEIMEAIESSGYKVVNA